MKKILKTIWRQVGYDQKKHWDRIALSFLSECESIVDIGCGEGRFISQAPLKIVGLDWNEVSLESCRRHGYKVIKGDARSLPFEDNSIWGIHYSHVIEHFPPSDVHKILSECDRVMMPKGILVIRSPLLWRGFYSDLTHVRPYNPDAITQYLTSAEPQRTLRRISMLYRVVHLRYRYRSLNVRVKILDDFFTALNQWGFPWLERTGYMLVLAKDA